MARRGSNEGSVVQEVPKSVGPYRVEAPLGAGGMGTVYRGYDARLDRPVALKQVHPATNDRDTARLRFRREARAAARLSHSAIVQVHDLVEEEDSGDWIVMELVEGRTLRQILKSGPLAPAVVIDIARQVLEGLMAAHAQGLLHRDLKAENVMVDATGKAKILDFGLAKNVATGDGDTTLTAEGKILGTASAMSPEQALGQPLDHRSDFFSFGTLLYEMAVGAGPFRSDNPVQTLTRIVTVRQPSAHEIVPSVPVDLSRLIDRLLEKEPARRPEAPRVLEELRALGGSGMLDSLGTESGMVAAPPLGDRTLRPSETGSEVTEQATTRDGALGHSDDGGTTAGQVQTMQGSVLDSRGTGSGGGEPTGEASESVISGVRVVPWLVDGATIPASRTTGASPDGALHAPPASPDAPSKAGWQLPVAGLVLVALLALVGAWLADRRDSRVEPPAAAGATDERETIPGTPPAGAASARPAIAILGFQNVSDRPETDWLSTAITEMLGSELAAGEQLRILPGEAVARMKRDLELPVEASLAADTLARIRRHLGTDFVLLGSYVVLGEEGQRTLRFDVRLQDTRRGEQVASANVSGSELDLFELAAHLGGELRRGLGLTAPTTSQSAAVRATMSQDPEATRLYAQGLEALRRDHALRARDLLSQAVERDQELALAHAALARAWLFLGYDQRSEQSARRAFELRTELPREAGLLIEGQYYETASRREEAVRSYQALWSFFPDNLEYGLALAEAQLHGTDSNRAQQTVGELRRLPGGLGRDPRIDLLESRILNQRSDFKGQLEAAGHAHTKGRERSAKHVEAKALSGMGAALFQLGDLDRAADHLTQSRQLLEELGMLRDAGVAMNTLANLHLTRGELDQGAETYRDALDIFRRIGDRRWTSTILNNLAVLVQNWGELTSAHRMLQESLELALETDDLSREAIRRDSLGWALLRLGELDAAEAQARRSLALAGEIERPYTAAWASFLLGEIALTRGELDTAITRLDEADALCESIGYRNLQGPIRARLAEAKGSAGELDTARQLLDEAIAIDRQLDAGVELARHRLAEARWSLAQGDPATAAETARDAVTQLSRERLVLDQLQALTVELEARLARSSDLATPATEDQRKTLATLARQVDELSVACQAPYHRIEAKLALAHFARFENDPAQAHQLCESVLDEATQRGFGRLVDRARQCLPRE